MRHLVLRVSFSNVCESLSSAFKRELWENSSHQVKRWVQIHRRQSSLLKLFKRLTSCSVYSFSRSCPETLSRTREVFSHRFYNVVTAAALTHKRLCTPVTACWVFFFFFLFERKVAAESIPWTKENHTRDSRREEHCSIMWYHAQSREVRAEQKSWTVADDLALRWLCVIEHDIIWWNSVLLAANLGDGSFFLSRVVDVVDIAAALEKLETREEAPYIVLHTQTRCLSPPVGPRNTFEDTQQTELLHGAYSAALPTNTEDTRTVTVRSLIQVSLRVGKGVLTSTWRRCANCLF